MDLWKATLRKVLAVPTTGNLLVLTVSTSWNFRIMALPNRTSIVIEFIVVAIQGDLFVEFAGGGINEVVVEGSVAV